MSLTEKEMQIIHKNLQAFEYNFGSVRIEHYTKKGAYYVFYPEDKPDDEYIQMCENIDYLNGWLYGVVQGVIRGEFKENFRKSY